MASTFFVITRTALRAESLPLYFVNELVGVTPFHVSPAAVTSVTVVM